MFPDSFLCLNMLRIYNEALTNVMKHAQAKSVRVNLDISGERVALAINDDGIGIRQGHQAGRGIGNMKNRAQELGGTLLISSQKGTTVFVELPLGPVHSLAS